MMSEGIQKVFESIGDGGCGFLAVLKHFRYEDTDILRMYRRCIKENKGLDKDCFVNSWKNLAQEVDPSGRKWDCKISKTLEPCDWYIEYWYNPRTKKHHFKLPDWDSLGESVTVAEGYIESYRLFTVIK